MSSGFIFNGEKTKWVDFESRFRVICTKNGTLSHVFPQTGANRLTKRNNPSLSVNEKRESVIANWQYTNSENNRFDDRETLSRGDLFLAILSPRLQEEVGGATLFADMYDRLENKYKPKRDANNNWTIDQVTSIRAAASRPIGDDVKLKIHIEDIERQLRVIDLDKTKDPFDFYDILHKSLTTSNIKGGTDTTKRFAGYYVKADEMALQGKQLEKYLLKRDDQYWDMKNLGTIVSNTTSSSTSSTNVGTSAINGNDDTDGVGGLLALGKNGGFRGDGNKNKSGKTHGGGKANRFKNVRFAEDNQPYSSTKPFNKFGRNRSSNNGDQRGGYHGNGDQRGGYHGNRNSHGGRNFNTDKGGSFNNNNHIVRRLNKLDKTLKHVTRQFEKKND